MQRDAPSRQFLPRLQLLLLLRLFLLLFCDFCSTSVAVFAAFSRTAPMCDCISRTAAGCSMTVTSEVTMLTDTTRATRDADARARVTAATNLPHVMPYTRSTTSFPVSTGAGADTVASVAGVIARLGERARWRARCVRRLGWVQEVE